MNAVEIEEAVSRLAEQPFEAESFPYAFLEAFGNKPTTLQRLKSGNGNQSDIGGVLQRGNIHLKVCTPGQVTATLGELRESKKTLSQKAKFILATDGSEFQAESLEGGGETLVCAFPDFHNHFGFFLPLAGISTVRQIRENAFDIKATGRLNRLYIELLKDNPEWTTAARREDLNHFMARLIFCFFAEDTAIFHSERLFTSTVEQMSARDSSDTHTVISELFRAMNTKLAARQTAKIRPWANVFPYVNGGLFSGSAGALAGIANEKANEQAGNVPSLASHSQADEGVGAPAGTLAGTGNAGALAGIANEKANEQADNVPSLASHSPADALVGAPRAPKWHSRGYIPHCDSQNLLQHITFRLADSLPQEKLKQLAEELEALPPKQRDIEKRKKIEAWLDAGMGCCALRHPEAAAIVQNTLLHADGDQYRLIAWCIMPNHVHVLIEQKSELATIVQAWKSISSRRILALNQSLALNIPNPKQLWMREYWDRYIRDHNHLRHCIAYIRDNPVKAGLCAKPEDWQWAGSAGSADALVGNANGQPMDRRNDPSLSPHSQANEGVGVPRAGEGTSAPEGASAPDVPRFSKIARTYLLHVGNLDWTRINPDIFGSMIQAVADDEERGALGMHYTSVPNILKVLNPLFLDDLRRALEEAGNNPRKLLNLRNRIARIRVFDPACGSGNFLVIAYKQMREIEAEINRRRGEAELKSIIPLTNYRGIELRHFSCEIARLALIIAEYQCDVLYRGQQLALVEFLPLEAANWITCGNALRLDWLSICPPTGKGVKMRGDDLFAGALAPSPALGTLAPSPAQPMKQAHEKALQGQSWTTHGRADEGVGAPSVGAPSEIDFANEGGETYICGNPPYLGSTWQSDEQKADLSRIFEGRTKLWKSLDYVAGWFMKAADYGSHTPCASAFVSTNSICQGQQVPILWPIIFQTGHVIHFAHTSFKWNNLASHNAGVTVVIVGITNGTDKIRRLYSMDGDGNAVLKEAENINAYLVAGSEVIVDKAQKPANKLHEMSFGNKPVDGGNLLIESSELAHLNLTPEQEKKFIRRIYGSAEFVRGLDRFVLWIEDQHLREAMQIEAIRKRVEGVRAMRLGSKDKSAQDMAKRAHQMREMNIGEFHTIAVPAITSENRDFLPCGLLDNRTTVTNKVYALYDAPLWNMALIASRLHWVWIGTVCVRLEMRFSYSNTLGWNTFPVPVLTEQNKTDLTRCAEEILLAREAHFPATIAELYKNADEGVGAPTMPADLRAAHDRNDETLERIYLGRRFKNDTERLEKLFELYTKMTTNAPATKKGAKPAKGRNA